MRRIPWVSDDRMVVLQAACAHFDTLANRGIEQASISRPLRRNRPLASSKIQGQNEVSPASVNSRGPANPDETGASTDGR